MHARDALDLRQLRLLRSAVGLPGSARARYAAAMHFFQEGRMDAGTLEVYRICATRDWDEPEALMRVRGLPDPLPPAPPYPPALAVEDCLDEADRHLATLPGPGVAEVRAGLARVRGQAVRLAPRRNPVVDAWLGPALETAAEATPALALALSLAAPHLAWRTYDSYGPDIGADFPSHHAFATLVGEDAPLRARGFDFGLFLIAPQVLYRDHAHAAPELYVPLTGPHGWRFVPGAPLRTKAAGEPVWNTPHRPHLIKAGPEPFLALYGWTADVDAPAYVLPADDWPALEALRLGP